MCITHKEMRNKKRLRKELVEFYKIFRYNVFKIKKDSPQGKGKINMIEIVMKNDLEESFSDFIGIEFEQFAQKNGVDCNYEPFYFIAKEDNKTMGILTGHSYYKEVYIENLMILEEYRHKHIGSKLIKAVENHFQDKGFDNMNLTTYAFQAPSFYEKCGFQIEFIRKNKENPKLDKYYFAKYF